MYINMRTIPQLNPCTYCDPSHMVGTRGEGEGKIPQEWESIILLISYNKFQVDFLDKFPLHTQLLFPHSVWGGGVHRSGQWLELCTGPATKLKSDWVSKRYSGSPSTFQQGLPS